MSVSSIKRWVDAGVLRATRTVGKHRLVPYSEALRFARDQGLSEGGLTAMVGTVPALVPAFGLDSRTVDALVDAIVQGDGRRAKSILHSAYATGRDAAALADHLIRPTMERVGHAWKSGTLDVYQEHQSSQWIAAALSELIERTARAQQGPLPLALGASPEGDLYTLSLLLGELVLRDSGWDVRNLGANLPLRSLSQAVLEYQPRLVFLSVSHVTDFDRFIADYRDFQESAAKVGAAVVVGGRALGPELRASLVYASYGERMAHLAEFAKRLIPPHGNSNSDRSLVGRNPGSPANPHAQTNQENG